MTTNDGSVDQPTTEDDPVIFRANGCRVCEADGRDIASITAAIVAAEADPRPSLAVCPP